MIKMMLTMVLCLAFFMGLYRLQAWELSQMTDEERAKYRCQNR